MRSNISRKASLFGPGFGRPIALDGTGLVLRVPVVDLANLDFIARLHHRHVAPKFPAVASNSPANAFTKAGVWPGLFKQLVRTKPSVGPLSSLRPAEVLGKSVESVTPKLKVHEVAK